MPQPTNEPDIEVRTYFARGRNALVARGDFSGIFAAWYLHRLDHGLEVPPAAEDAGREALAALTLHCASRPWKEVCAWTIRFPDPRINIFVAGDNTAGTVIANLQAAETQPIAHGMFHADVVEDGGAPRRSVVDFRETSVLRAVEAFYSRSEQRLVRFFWHGEEDLALLEKRSYNFLCGCNQGRMLDYLQPVFRRQAEELFEGDETLTVVCPRCGARHVLTREAFEARGKSDPEGL